MVSLFTSLDTIIRLGIVSGQILSNLVTVLFSLSRLVWSDVVVFFSNVQFRLFPGHYDQV